MAGGAGGGGGRGGAGGGCGRCALCAGVFQYVCMCVCACACACVCIFVCVRVACTCVCVRVYVLSTYCIGGGGLGGAPGADGARPRSHTDRMHASRQTPHTPAASVAALKWEHTTQPRCGGSGNESPSWLLDQPAIAHTPRPTLPPLLFPPMLSSTTTTPQAGNSVHFGDGGYCRVPLRCQA